jgi:hypothetical protein
LSDSPCQNKLALLPFLAQGEKWTKARIKKGRKIIYPSSSKENGTHEKILSSISHYDPLCWHMGGSLNILVH